MGRMPSEAKVVVVVEELSRQYGATGGFFSQSDSVLVQVVAMDLVGQVPHVP